MLSFLETRFVRMSSRNCSTFRAAVGARPSFSSVRLAIIVRRTYNCTGRVVAVRRDFELSVTRSAVAEEEEEGGITYIRIVYARARKTRSNPRRLG